MAAACVSLLAALKQHFGFDSFRPGQEEIVRHALAGRDVSPFCPLEAANPSASSFRPSWKRD